MRRLVFVTAIGLVSGTAPAAIATPMQMPRPPAPERVRIGELPLPPTAPSVSPGSCTRAINPRGSGCIGTGWLQSGSFIDDGRTIVAVVAFAGAPAAPDPAAIYAGPQTILIRTDGSHFPNGDAWKCITCGVPAANAVGTDRADAYPQTFHDGRRLLIGSNVVDCAPFLLEDARCTPDKVHVYPIRFGVTADGSGKGGLIRELRIHPDNVHLGFNAVSIEGGRFDQFGYVGRLVFDPAPKTGLPLAPRYDLVMVNRLFRPGLDQRVLTVDPRHRDRLVVNRQGIEVGEFRGFTKDGREAFYIGYPHESTNIDIFAVELTSGHVRRVTSNPEYADPIDSSPDDKWVVVDDTRGSGRQLFAAAMRGIPPITDLVTTSAVSSMRNNHQRRFFQPILIDRAGDRGRYQGQRLNAGDGTPGSASDPNWNAMADPRWAPDGTAVVYWQAQVVSPGCGGANPLPCPAATEPGGRRARIMIARLPDRRPVRLPLPAAMADTIPWGVRYVPGSPMPQRALIPAGTYTLRGQVSGAATVTIRHRPDDSAIEAASASYAHYSDDGITVLDGTESAAEHRVKPTVTRVDWRSDLVQSGATRGTKRTSPDGFALTIDIMDTVFEATGTMVTTIDGVTYRQPVNGS